MPQRTEELKSPPRDDRDPALRGRGGIILGESMPEPPLFPPGSNPTTGQPGLRDIPRTWAGTVKIQSADMDTAIIAGTNLTANQQTERPAIILPTIATTGTDKAIIRVWKAGTIGAITMTTKADFAANDTNYLTFAANNRGVVAANVPLLTAVDNNTTKATGGAGFTALIPRAFSGNSANFAVVAGDVIEFSWSVTGTLSGTIVGAIVTISIVTT